MKTTFEQKASMLTQHGLSVFPLVPMLKIPVIAKSRGGRGCLDATVAPQTIANWSIRYQKANVGVGTGETSGVIVIDLDPKNGSAASVSSLRAKGMPFPRTVCCKTPRGGWHLYYKWKSGISNSVSAISAGIDVRSDGGYVVAPPSETRDGAYRWFIPFEEMVPADLPDWIVEALKPKPKTPIPATYVRKLGDGPISHLFDIVANAREGRRNVLLFWSACRIAEKGKIKSVEGQLVSAACQAGMELAEIMRTIKSATDLYKSLNP